jgi:hypothetical protein
VAGVQWLFTRDLLIAGLIDSVGDGDIGIASDEADAGQVVIELRGPDRCAVLTVATAVGARVTGRLSPKRWCVPICP